MRGEEGDWEAEKGRVGMYQRELWVSERGTTRELVERGRQRKRGLVCTREILSYGGAREGTRGGRVRRAKQRKGGLVCMRGSQGWVRDKEGSWGANVCVPAQLSGSHMSVFLECQQIHSHLFHFVLHSKPSV